MGLFDFLKPKKTEMEEMFEKMSAKIFPKGEKDINAVVDSLLYILDNKISREEAKSIALKSTFLSRFNTNFDRDRLRSHLAGYCLQHFNDKQIETFHGYLVFLTIADAKFRKTPSEIIREGDGWIIPAD